MSANKALVRRWFDEVWNKGRAEAIEELLASDGVARGLGPDLRGPAEFKPFHASFRGAFPDIRIAIEDAIEEGDQVAFRWTAQATHTGSTLGFPATSKQATFSGLGIVRIRDGKIVEGWNSFDQLGMLTQLGVVTPPA